MTFKEWQKQAPPPPHVWLYCVTCKEVHSRNAWPLGHKYKELVAAMAPRAVQKTDLQGWDANGSPVP